MPTLVSLALDQGLNLLGTVLGPWVLLVPLAAATGLWLMWRRRATAPEPPRHRHYTLLRTEGADGAPVRYETTRPAGTKIVQWVGGRQRLYELTGVQLADGTYAAEPLDQH